MSTKFVHNLRHYLHNFRSQIAYLAALYRNMGLVFFSWPVNIQYDTEIDFKIRGFTRNAFVLAISRELPPLIQLLGLLDHTLSRVANRLCNPANDGKVRQAHRLLIMVEAWLLEAWEEMELVGQAVNIYERLWFIRRLEGQTLMKEGNESRERRANMRKKWSIALPLVCWEGYKKS